MIPVYHWCIRLCGIFAEKTSGNEGKASVTAVSSKLVSVITKRRWRTMKQTVAAYIAKTLEQAGVKRIWGVTGDSLNGLER
jgi:hypothetical protein